MPIDATAQVDQIIANANAATLVVWITLGVIVIALIALGSEFWVNIWGLIVAPAITSQRLLGEGQWVPGIVVVAISGMASAAILLSYFSHETIVTGILKIVDVNNPVVGPIAEQLDSLFSQLGSDFSIKGNIEYIKKFTFQTLTVSMYLPLAYLVVWFLWGIAGQLGSMIAGNKAGHGIISLWSAIPYLFLLSILMTWLSMLQLYGHVWARWFGWLVELFYLFLLVVMMREHGRYKISNAIIAIIFSYILLVALLVILLVLIVFLSVQLGHYL